MVDGRERRDAPGADGSRAGGAPADLSRAGGLQPGRSRRRWWIAVAAALGVVAGLGVVVARCANAPSYLSDAPDACINCHVMTDAFASWQRGSHAREAVCNDCHVPHANPVATYAFKATDGARHSYVFTFRLEPQVIRLSAGAEPVVQTNCVRCHADQLRMVRLADAAERRCWDCHTNIHGEVQSLSASPVELRPSLPPAGLPLPEPRSRP
jgi:cytochrome c nitrite reductase small subunit